MLVQLLSSLMMMSMGKTEEEKAEGRKQSSGVCGDPSAGPARVNRVQPPRAHGREGPKPRTRGSIQHRRAFRLCDTAHYRLRERE